MPSALVLETPEGNYLVQPGVSAHIGRHPNADIRLDKPSVSRLHAWLRWNRGEDYPIISDYQSMCGLEVDDQLVKWKHLHDTHHIGLGEEVLTARFFNDADAVMFEYLEDLITLPTCEKVVTTKIKKINYYANPETYKPLETVRFKKPRLRVAPGLAKSPNQGCLKESTDLHALLQKLEHTRATGTLSLCCEYKGSLTFQKGVITGAECGRMSGRTAFQQILTFANVSYQFFTVIDNDAVDPEMSLRPSEFLSQMRRHETGRVDRPSQRFRKVFKGN